MHLSHAMSSRPNTAALLACPKSADYITATSAAQRNRSGRTKWRSPRSRPGIGQAERTSALERSTEKERHSRETAVTGSSRPCLFMGDSSFGCRLSDRVLAKDKFEVPRGLLRRAIQSPNSILGHAVGLVSNCTSRHPQLFAKPCVRRFGSESAVPHHEIRKRFDLVRRFICAHAG